MEKNINVKEWQEAFKIGLYDGPSRKTQIDAGWYDWFCRDSSLAGKTKRMGSIVKQVKNGGKVDLDKMYVWFKNNCPLNGPLYDDFRFADIATGTTMITIQINCCWNKHRYTVFARRNVDDDMETETPAFETDSSRELVKWLNTRWEA